VTDPDPHVPAPPPDPVQPDETDSPTGFDGDLQAVQDADIYAEAAAASTAR
jgi:hypothetical protein